MWSFLPPAHPPEESPLALKSKTCVNDLHRARRSHTHTGPNTSTLHWKMSQDGDGTKSLLWSLTGQNYLIVSL